MASRFKQSLSFHLRNMAISNDYKDDVQDDLDEDVDGVENNGVERDMDLDDDTQDDYSDSTDDSGDLLESDDPRMVAVYIKSLLTSGQITQEQFDELQGYLDDEDWEMDDIRQIVRHYEDGPGAGDQVVEEKDAAMLMSFLNRRRPSKTISDQWVDYYCGEGPRPKFKAPSSHNRNRAKVELSLRKPLLTEAESDALIDKLSGTRRRK